MSPSEKKNTTKAKFLLDENVDLRLVSYLQKQGFPTEICPKGLQNGAVIELAYKKSLVLLTNDKDFANPDLYKPADNKGIIIFRVHPPSLTNLTQALEKLLSKFKPDELSEKLFIITKEEIEIHE